MVLAPFIEGLMDAGSDVETFYTGHLKIKPCTCGECTAGTSSQCGKTSSLRFHVERDVVWTLQRADGQIDSSNDTRKGRPCSLRLRIVFIHIELSQTILQM